MYKYPIYNIDVKFRQDRTSNDYNKGSWWIQGCKKNRQRNILFKTLMFKNDKTEEELLKYCEYMWKNHKKKNKHQNPSCPKFRFKLVDREEWCLGWFDHWTFDVGQTDSEVLQSL